MAVNTPPPQTSSGYIIGTQDPLSPYYQGTSYWGGQTPRSFTPTGGPSVGRTLNSGYVIGTQIPGSPYFQGANYTDQRGGGAYLARELQQELVARGYYSSNAQNRGAYPSSAGVVNPANPVNSSTNQPLLRTGASPVNRGAGGTSGGRTPNPGRAVNNTVPAAGALGRAAIGNAAAGGVLAGGFAAYGAARNGGGFFETIGAGLGGAAGATAGGLTGTAVGAAIGGSVGTVTVPLAGAIPGAAVGGVIGGYAGAGVGGAIGASAGRGVGRAIDNAIPDFPLPWPFNGRPESDYPSQLPPNALGQGPKTDEGTDPPFRGGQSSGVLYRVAVGRDFAISPTKGQTEYVLNGPITGITSTSEPLAGTTVRSFFLGHGGTAGYPNPVNIGSAFSEITTGFPPVAQPNPGNFSIVDIVRADGLPDTGGDPPGGAAPTYAPNPARRPPASSPRPRNLPPPITTPQPGLQPTGGTNPNGTPQYGPGPHPWPGSDPAYRAEPPLAPTPAAPPNFQPSNLGDPAPAFDPAKDIASQPDLDNPAAEAPALQGNPGTPPVPDNPAVQVSGIPGINTGVLPQVPQVPLIVPLPMRQTATTPRNPTQPFPPQQPQNPNQPDTNPNVDNRPRPRPPTTPNPNPRALCRYEQQRAMDIQRKATSTEQRAANPVSGFPGLYGLQIESRVKQGQIFDLVTSTKEFMQKAWEMSRIQKVLDVLTFIAVMHNVSMLSRDVGETFMQLVSQALQAIGIRDEEGQVIDVQEVVGDTVENLLKQVLGAERYDGINEAWNKANRIISSASAVIWTVRSIADASLDLTEWIAEHTGKIGNALKRWGVVGERDYPWMSENAKAQTRFRARFSKVTNTLENAEDYLSTGLQATGNVIEIQEETAELGENWQRFKQSVEDGIPDPWLDNLPLKAAYDEAKAESDSIPPIPPAVTQQGV